MSQPSVVLGIDIGTQSLKVCAVDANLQVLASDKSSYGYSCPKPGHAEQDPSVWLAALAPTIAKVLHKAALQAQHIAGLAICGQLDGSIALDAGGQTLGPCLLWMDRRATEVSAPPADMLRDIAGQVFDPSHMAAKIVWQKANLTGAKTFHQPVSYLVHVLTGQSVMDGALASTTMLFDLQKNDYASRLLDHFAISREELPRIAQAVDVAGHLHAHGASLTGLKQGTLVAVGTGDDFSSMLGAGIATSGKIGCVLGTAEVIGAVSATAIRDEKSRVETHRYVTGEYFLENPGWLSGGAIEWACQVLSCPDAKTLDSWATAAPAGSDGVLFLPALSGAMNPEWNAHASGVFFGLSASHGKQHMARAVLEGCAYAMADTIELLSTLGLPGDVVLLGGGAQSSLWQQIRADVLGRDIAVATQAGSEIGAALCAAVAVGWFPNLAQAAQKLPENLQTVPCSAGSRDVYMKQRSKANQLYYALRPLFDV